MWKPEGRRPLGRPRRRWENYTEIDIQEVEWELRLDRSDSEQGQVACSCECGTEPLGLYNAGNFLTK